MSLLAGLPYNERTMALSRRVLLVLTAGAGVGLLHLPAPAAAQAFVPASSAHPAILFDIYLNYPKLLLTPPRSLDLASASVSDEAVRTAAYLDFQRDLRERTRGIVGTAPGSEQRRQFKRKVLSAIGDRLTALPGGFLVREGRALWERVDRATNLNLDGYRLRLRVDEAAEGKFALGVRKQLR